MGIVYLVQPAQLVGTDRYKIGCSRENDPRRVINGYNDGTRTIVIEGVDNPFDVERQLVQRFAQHFTQVGGREYFAGNGEAMRVCFKAVTSEVTGNGREVTGNELTIEDDGGARDANVEKVVETDTDTDTDTDAGKVDLLNTRNTKSNNRQNIEYRCKKCNKTFSRNQTLKEHQNKCTGLNPLQCPICLKTFATRFGKANHKKYVKCSPPQPQDSPYATVP